MKALGASLRVRFTRTTKQCRFPPELSLFWKDLDVRLSDSDEPGEGEQKIFARIKASERLDDVHFVYGLDADLVLLSSLCHPFSVYVLRPWDTTASSQRDRSKDRDQDGHHKYPQKNNQYQYHLIDVPRLRGVVHGLVASDSEKASVLEYAVLCSLLGNDFVPGIACLPVAEASVQHVLGAYRSARGTCYDNHHENARLVLTDNRREGGHTTSLRVNLHLLNEIIGRLAGNEDARMRQVDADYYDPRKRRNDHTSSEAILHPDVVRPREAGWRLRYYRHLFGPDQRGIVERACLNYLEGLEWSLNYHCQLGVDCTWYYRHAYAPTALDLGNFLALNADRIMRLGRLAPSPKPHGLNEEMQLLMVLPPQSLLTVLPEFADIASDPRRGCVQFYPHLFRTMSYLKRHRSECVPVLPEIDSELIAEQYRVTKAKTRAKTRVRRIPQGSAAATKDDVTPTVH